MTQYHNCNQQNHHHKRQQKHYQHHRTWMRKLSSLMLILMLLLSAVPWSTMSVAQTTAQSTLQATEQKMIVHYHRFDGNYDGWNLWIWANGKDGKAYEFQAEDAYGKTAEILIEDVSGADEIGFIVRKGEWEAKDIDVDRFVSLSKVNADGVLEIYLVQGAETVYFSESEIDLSPKFLKASFIDATTVKLTTSKPISKQEMRTGFSVVSEGISLRPTAVSAGSGDLAQDFVVMLDGEVQIGQNYQTSFGDYEPVSIEMTGLYDTQAFTEMYGYDGELGALYTPEKTTFRVWAPTASSMQLNLYEAGDGGKAMATETMKNIGQGVWEFTKSGDLHGFYYTFSVTHEGKVTETYDPYAKSAGVNGDRSMVIDFSKAQPENWSQDQGPVYENNNDLIVYEMHIRDLSTHSSSNITHIGKFLGVVEKDTKTESGVTTGLSHLKELGVTHVQILPMYDYNSVDETKLDENIFNWGYDPKNYSVPEGSYATDPYKGEVRVQEMKQMVAGLHEAGIGVIMDVVYNHTALSADSNLNVLVPNYYYRMVDGKFSNASGTGNETASERAMVRKLMVDSLKHWVSEYHIDGFRFDLMGVHDIETMTYIETELRKINPNIILYGEGWTGGSSPLPEGLRLVKKNMTAVERIGAFNDDFRDGVKGHVFNAEEAGFVGGAVGLEESVKFGIVGAVFHPQVDYKSVNYSQAPWANNPSQSVNYVSAHDNLTLWDKLLVTNPDASEEQRIAMHKLSNAIVLTSQGMPFLHAGVDFLRTKGGDHNSYKSPDEVNWLDWTLKEKHADVFEYYKGLIQLRKAYPAFSMNTQAEIEANLTFYTQAADSAVQLKPQMIGYELSEAANTTTGAKLIVLFNGSLESQSITLPSSNYKVLVNAEKVDVNGTQIIRGGEIDIKGSSALILEVTDQMPKEAGLSSRAIYTIAGVGAGALLAVVYVLFSRRKKYKRMFKS